MFRRPKLQEEKPNLQFGEYSKLIAEEWKTMELEKKQKYLDVSMKNHRCWISISFVIDVEKRQGEI